MISLWPQESSRLMAYASPYHHFPAMLTRCVSHFFSVALAGLHTDSARRLGSQIVSALAYVSDLASTGR